MDSLTRRRALQAGGLVVSIAVAGCSSTETERRPDFDTPPPGECEAVEPPSSGPTRGGLEPVAYPPYPEEIGAETARAFARDFEHAFRRNEFVQRYEDSWYDELDVNVSNGELVGERHGGYVVEVDGRVLHGDSSPPETATGTARPAGRVPFTAWYYLTDRFVLRYENPHADEPNFEYAEVVACDE